MDSFPSEALGVRRLFMGLWAGRAESDRDGQESPLETRQPGVEQDSSVQGVSRSHTRRSDNHPTAVPPSVAAAEFRPVLGYGEGECEAGCARNDTGVP